MGVDEAKDAATIAMKQVDGEVLKKLRPGDEGTADYDKMLASLCEVKEACHVAYLYTLSTDGQNVYFGIDTDETGGQVAIGDEFGGTYEELQTVFEGMEYVQDYIDSTEDGDLRLLQRK